MQLALSIDFGIKQGTKAQLADCGKLAAENKLLKAEIAKLKGVGVGGTSGFTA
jgi:hypothetical protein